MTKTKKVGPAGRFGVRYGKTIRERWSVIERKRKEKQKCPYCGKLSCKRIAKGLWLCKSCKRKFTAGAYTVSASE